MDNAFQFEIQYNNKELEIEVEDDKIGFLYVENEKVLKEENIDWKDFIKNNKKLVDVLKWLKE